jgi:hypothetical protein
MRTSFHHQPEAQHPQIFSYPQIRRPITPSNGIRQTLDADAEMRTLSMFALRSPQLGTSILSHVKRQLMPGQRHGPRWLLGVHGKSPAPRPGPVSR